MPNLNAIDGQLLQIVTAPAPHTIADVIARMEAIDALLPNNDGLKWFNRLYLMVTQAIDGQPPQTAWSDPVWLVRLDVVFAGFFFTAVASFLEGSAATPGSWNALLEARARPDVDRIQFALAGMNAHINHDLALALLQTDRELGLAPDCSSPQHADYERVNATLAQVLPAALTVLATGVLGTLAQDTGKIGQLLAIWNVAVARDAAWDFADCLRSLPDPQRAISLKVQDRVTGLAGRSLLLPLQGRS